MGGELLQCIPQITFSTIVTGMFENQNFTSKCMETTWPQPGLLLTKNVAQWLERSPREREVVGSIPDRVIPKTL